MTSRTAAHRRRFARAPGAADAPGVATATVGPASAAVPGVGHIAAIVIAIARPSRSPSGRARRMHDVTVDVDDVVNAVTKVKRRRHGSTDDSLSD